MTRAMSEMPHARTATTVANKKPRQLELSAMRRAKKVKQAATGWSTRPRVTSRKAFEWYSEPVVAEIMPAMSYPTVLGEQIFWFDLRSGIEEPWPGTKKGKKTHPLDVATPITQ
jgi:hypothetical protein